VNDGAVLESLRDWFDRYVEQFLSGDRQFCRNIEIKRDHTRRVCSEIVDLAESQGLAPGDIAFCESLALLHDVGRFEQYRRYGTFSDGQSEDHARLGIRILEDHRVLAPLDPEERDLFYRCLGYHNRLRIPEDETSRCLQFSRLLRDADKLDIWRVVTAYYSAPAEPENPVLMLGLSGSPEISDAVADAVTAGRLCDVKDLRTVADFKVLQMSWIFDLNFPLTYQRVDDREYLEKITGALPRSRRAERIYRSARYFLDAKLALSR
jgi:hypothetical protein